MHREHLKSFFAIALHKVGGGGGAYFLRRYCVYVIVAYSNLSSSAVKVFKDIVTDCAWGNSRYRERLPNSETKSV